MTQVPAYDQLMVPLFTALRELGGSASISEIDEKVGELLSLPEEILELPHNPWPRKDHHHGKAEHSKQIPDRLPGSPRSRGDRRGDNGCT